MSPSPPPLAVTGATGRIGGLVARRLEGADVVQASYGDAEASRRALAGIDTLFMVSAAETRERLVEHTTFVDAAAETGVRRIVYLSFIRAAPDATFTLARDHWATEEHIRGRGLVHTFLRDNLYLDFPAAVATAVLEQPDQHDGATYDVTGGEELSLHEAAHSLSVLLGRPVTYLPETIEEAYASRARYGAPGWQVDACVSTYTAIAAGEMAGVSDTVERLTGRAPMTLAEAVSPATG